MEAGRMKVPGTLGIGSEPTDPVGVIATATHIAAQQLLPAILPWSPV